MALRTPPKFPCIAGVTTYPDGTEVCDTKTAAGKREYRRRTEAMWERQGGLCAICNKPLRIDLATYDHAGGRGMGGSRTDDRISDADGNWLNAAVCWLCNGEKSSRRAYWRDGKYEVE